MRHKDKGEEGAERRGKVPVAMTFDKEAIAGMLMRVKGSGFVPAADLKEEFGPDRFSQCIAILYRDFRMFREVRRPWGDEGKEVLGYEWADRRFSRQEVKKIPPDLNFLIDATQQLQAKYGAFQPITVRCRWTTPILGSVPKKDEHQDPVNCFERDIEGNFLVLRYHQRAMASIALPFIGKESAAARHLGFSVIRIPSTTPVKIVEHGIVEVNRSGGKGLGRKECISDGLEFTIRALIPTSVLQAGEFLQMLRLAGQHVGLSPGRSSGFGDFEILEAE